MAFRPELILVIPYLICEDKNVVISIDGPVSLIQRIRDENWSNWIDDGGRINWARGEINIKSWYCRQENMFWNKKRVGYLMDWFWNLAVWRNSEGEWIRRNDVVTIWLAKAMKRKSRTRVRKEEQKNILRRVYSGIKSQREYSKHIGESYNGGFSGYD